MNMKIETKIEKKLRKAIEYLKSIGCREIILFGSLANGTADDFSDIDLAITGLEPRTYFKAVAVISSIVGQRVDLITMDYVLKDFEDKIRKEGIRLYGT